MREKPPGCVGCPAYTLGRGYVEGRGPSDARMALIGQGPGRTEAAMDEPFIGLSGQRLDKWLARARINRFAAWVDNIVRCHMPNDRPPNRKELTHCLETHVLPGLRGLDDLRVIVPIGKIASKHLLLRLASPHPGNKSKSPSILGDSVGAQIPVATQSLASSRALPTTSTPLSCSSDKPMPPESTKTSSRSED